MRRISVVSAFVLAVLSSVSLFGQGAAEKRHAVRSPIVEAASAASPAVVNISTEKIISMRAPDVRHRLFDDDTLDKFFEQYHQQNLRQRSLGSGVLIDRRGYIVTNEHVVRRASRITVTLNDKSSYNGTLVSADPSRDLAVIKISRDMPFPIANLYRREPLLVGETAIAVGNPFGFEHTVTAGVISAIGRNVSVDGQIVMRDLVQTDASINPGNSGGALVDINGDLIGINTAIRSGAEGIGFAIAVQEVRQTLVDLLDFRRLSKVWIGAGLAGLVNIETNEPVGMRVEQIQPGSPAARAGMKQGDVITKLNGRGCVDVLAFEIDILEHKSGDKLVFEGVRESVPFQATLVLEAVPVKDPNAVIAARLGMTVGRLSAADATRVGVEAGSGVIITDVAKGGPAAASGLSKDDVILLFANFRVAEPEELASGVERIKSGDQAVLVLMRKGFKYYTWVRVN
jgi:serine protease Do